MSCSRFMRILFSCFCGFLIDCRIIYCLFINACLLNTKSAKDDFITDYVICTNFPTNQWISVEDQLNTSVDLENLRAACVKTSIKDEIMLYWQQLLFPTVPFKKLCFNRFGRLRCAIKTNDTVLRILSSIYSNRCQIGQRWWLMNRSKRISASFQWCKGEKRLGVIS